MNAHKVNGEVARLQEALDMLLGQWERAFEDDPEAQIENRFEDTLHALRGWSPESASAYEWALEFTQGGVS